MCLAVPVQVVAIADEPTAQVVVRQGDRRGEACAALVTPPGGLVALVGAWVVVHTGYILEILDDGDARSRLAMFAAIDGQAVEDAAIRPPADLAG